MIVVAVCWCRLILFCCSLFSSVLICLAFLAFEQLIPLTSTTPQAIFNDLVEKSLYPLKLHLKVLCVSQNLEGRMEVEAQWYFAR
jgi:hypothetical protein